jgi:hypothetical protein
LQKIKYFKNNSSLNILTMKKIVLTLTIALGATLSQAQNVGIGTSSPSSSAKLDISASDKGI